MRRLLHGLIGLCRCLVLVTIGAGLLGFTLAGPRCYGADCWIWLLDTLRPYRDLALAAGGGIVFLELLYRLTRPRRREDDIIDFKGKGGAITVRLQTVADHLERIADEYDEILSLEPGLIRRKKSVDVELAIRVKDGANVPELCRSLQDRVRQTIAGHVGPFAVRRVEIQVDELVRQPGGPADAVSEGVAGVETDGTRGADVE